MKNIIAILICILFIIACANAQDCAFVFDKLPIIQKDTVMTWKGLKPVFIESGNEVEVTITFKVKAPPVPVVTTVNNTELTFTGSWEHPQGTWGSVSHSSTVGSTAKYSFTGSRVEVISDMAATHGKLGYTINSGVEKVVDLYSADRKNGVIVIDEQVPSGFNTITFRVKSNTVLIDYMRISR